MPDSPNRLDNNNPNDNNFSDNNFAIVPEPKPDPLKGLSDEGRAWLSDADDKQRKPMMKGIIERFGHEAIQADILTLSFNENKPNPLLRGRIKASQLPDPVAMERIWFGLYPASVILVIGETGAGKSSLFYNMFIHAARNEPLWGIDFGLHRPIKVLYFDPENAGNWEEGRGGNCTAKIYRIGAGKPELLEFHDGLGINFSDPTQIATLREIIVTEKIDVVVLDPIANLFGTKDENDNAEAAAAMKSLTALTRQTGVCIVACHHTGKDSSGNYGRGASARLSAADVGIVFRARGASDEIDDDYTGELVQRDDVCRFQIVKNRWEGKASLYLKMDGEDRFSRTDFSAWKTAARNLGAPISKPEIARTELVHLLMDGKEHTRAEIREVMQEEGVGENTTNEVLKAMIDEGRIDVITGPKNAKSYRNRKEETNPAPSPFAGISGLAHVTKPNIEEALEI